MARVFSDEHRRKLSEAARARVARDPQSVVTNKGRRQTRAARKKMKEAAARRYEEKRRARWLQECEWARAEGRPEPKWDPMKSIGHKTTGKRARKRAADQRAWEAKQAALKAAEKAQTS